MPPRPRARNIRDVKEEDLPPPPPTSKASSSRKAASRTRISAACEACKKRKTKCTGEPAPCHLCLVLGTECVIDLTLDMRRRAALQQTIDNSRSFQESLKGLIEIVRDGDLETLQSLQELFRRDGITPQETAAAIQHCTQSLKGRVTDLEQDERNLAGSDTTPDQHAQSSPVVQHEEQEDQWPIEPSLRDGFDGAKELDSPGYLGALHRRLRECSEIEGERILTTLLKASRISEVEKNIPLDGARLKDDRAMDMVDLTLAGTSMSHQVARMYWHPALQLGTSSFVSDMPAEAMNKLGSGNVNQEPSIHGWGAVGQADGNTRFPAGLSTTELQRVTGDFMAQSHGSIQKHQAFALPTRLQTPYIDGQKSSSMVVKPAVTDLIVAKGNSGSQIKIPIHLIQPLLIPDDCSMSRVYTDYLYGARQAIANGALVRNILGPDDDIIVDLFFRQRQDGDKWDCSSWASEFCCGFGEFDIYLRLASVLMLTRLMQWLLCPTIESYAKLPDVMKPSPTQRMVPHIPAIDLIPMPCIRDVAIEKLRDWLTPLAEARWTVNWPHFQDDAVEYDTVTGSRRLTQRFVDHVLDYSNWSVGAQFLNSFPEVAGRLRIHS